MRHVDPLRYRWGYCDRACFLCEQAAYATLRGHPEIATRLLSTKGTDPLPRQRQRRNDGSIGRSVVEFNRAQRRRKAVTRREQSQ